MESTIVIDLLGPCIDHQFGKDFNASSVTTLIRNTTLCTLRTPTIEKLHYIFQILTVAAHETASQVGCGGGKGRGCVFQSEQVSKKREEFPVT